MLKSLKDYDDAAYEADLDEEIKDNARSHLLDFTTYTKPDYVVNWHHKVLADKLTDFAFGKIKYLMIFAPPRMGKSELVSRRLSPFIHGNFPDAEIMACSYSDSLARGMTIDTQTIIDSKEYKELFPHVEIARYGSSPDKGERNANKHDLIGYKGKYTGQGVGGSFTGKGANFICFPKGVDVCTRSGYKDISELKEGEYVWSYNHTTNKQELKRVQAVFCNRVSELVRVTTTKGRSILCTPDHPFFSETQQRYKKAKDLGNDGLLLFSLSRSSPSVERDQVSFVERVSSKEVDVYDIKVEGNHNFFADQVLVHNCIDDPIKGRETADSEAFREKLWEFWLNDLYSRLETDLKSGREGQVLLTLTRWHEADLAGQLLEKMAKDEGAIQWDVVKLPAIKMNDDDPLDPREIGEPLWPEKYNLRKMMEIKNSAGTRAWGSLYQQEPRAMGGNIFKAQMFEFTTMPHDFDYIFSMSDTAYTEKQENDFHCTTVFGVLDDEMYIIDVWMIQIKASDVEEPMESFLSPYVVHHGYRGTYIEPKGHGIYLNQKFVRKGNRMVIPSDHLISDFFKDRRGDKVTRANNMVPRLGNRKVYINQAIANKEDLVNQALGFPKVKHDDFVDTLIDGIKMVYAREVSILDVL